MLWCVVWWLDAERVESSFGARCSWFACLRYTLAIFQTGFECKVNYGQR